VVALLLTKLRNIAESVSENSVKIGEYLAKLQARAWLSRTRLANTLLKDEESARDNHALAGNFAKYSPILKLILLTDSAINLS